MDKWEQVAEGIVTDWDDEDILKWTSLKVMIGEALRQCEADTIRRCADVVGAVGQSYMISDGRYQDDGDYSAANACERAAVAINALLLQESAQ